VRAGLLAASCASVALNPTHGATMAVSHLRMTHHQPTFIREPTALAGIAAAINQKLCHKVTEASAHRYDGAAHPGPSRGTSWQGSIAQDAAAPAGDKSTRRVSKRKQKKGGR
jgi:hypothetical protein